MYDGQEDEHSHLVNECSPCAKGKIHNSQTSNELRTKIHEENRSHEHATTYVLLKLFIVAMLF